MTWRGPSRMGRDSRQQWDVLGPPSDVVGLGSYSWAHTNLMGPHSSGLGRYSGTSVCAVRLIVFFHSFYIGMVFALRKIVAI